MSHARETLPSDSLEGALARILADVTDTTSDDPLADARAAAALAAKLQVRATELQTSAERKQQRELDKMIRNPHDKATMIQMTDQTFRSERPKRAVSQLTHILDAQGVPRYFSPIDQALIRGFQSFGSYLPGVAVPLIKEKMRAETANVILPAEDRVLGSHLARRNESGLRMNVNLLGEAMLGEEEAKRRLASYLDALANPTIESISVKVSTIYSQLSSVGYEHTLAVLCERLERLYREASRHSYRRADGSEVSKFVYLDMEEYKDLQLTAEAFMQTLSRPGLETARGGIALQSYVPDSYLWQCRLNEWARERVAAGGTPVTLRIVKGANMEAERVEASARGWPQAPYKDKRSTDANFKRMLHEAFKPENIEAVTLGIASHNLFEIAYALVLAVRNDCLDRLQFEMLEGMANHIRRALAEMTGNLVLYAPATRRENFINAIGYLVRRLDENTGPDNFLSHAFKLVPGDDEWQRLEGQFFESFDFIDSTPCTPRRTQDRLKDPVPPVQEDGTPFVNEPDTDFALHQNVDWASGLIDRWHVRHGEQAADVPIRIGDDEHLDREVRESVDPSRPGTVVARYRLATTDDIEAAVSIARRNASGWRDRSASERSAVLGKAANELRAARGDLMGAAMAEGGKIFLQSDPEVSEAIDFCEYYRRSACEFEALEGTTAEGRGVVAVVPPWNFPIAIPCGGIAAALAAGNSVIVKPASDTVLTAWLLVQAFWRAGVPGDALQFLPCDGGSVGAVLAAHHDVDVVILTGGTDTALRMLDARPDMDLFAETGGKNATIVTAMADRDLAIAHVLQSAFGHSGQKCSATSLLVLEAEIYDDPRFRNALVDAAASMTVGSAWQPETLVGPMIHPPGADLERGLTRLEPGEEWALKPHIVDDNPSLWSPGIKWNVQPGSFTHMTELFGPVLGVMRARDLDEAIELVNATGYGLTSGLESLDDREQATWQEHIRAGNLYINRVTTGAIVLRQPFGGMGKSAFGPGIKAGGPNYVLPLMRFSQTAPPPASGEISNEDLRALEFALADPDAFTVPRLEAGDRATIRAAIRSADRCFSEHFAAAEDSFRLIGQDNLRRYLPAGQVRVRVSADDTPVELFVRAAAARAAGNHVTISTPPDYRPDALVVLEHLTESWGGAIEFVEETDDELAVVVASRGTDRVRFAAPGRAPEVVQRAVGDTGVYLASQPVNVDGRLELPWYLREQSLSFDYHRYGTLGDRATERRADTE